MDGPLAIDVSFKVTFRTQ